MYPSALPVALFLHTVAAASSFNLYTNFDPAGVELILGFSAECLEALNATVNCDSATTLLAAQGPDETYWSQDNLTTFCTDQCASSMTSWVSNVENRCAGQSADFGDTIVQAVTDPLLVAAGHDLLCLKDSSGSLCYLESQDWQGSDYVRYDPPACLADDPDRPEGLCDGTHFSTEINILPEMTNVTRLYDSELVDDSPQCS
ncbi:LysM domain-containing protein [Fulvia fulva]|nr:LysM domain-containing protein [Fulvia fulva]